MKYQYSSIKRQGDTEAAIVVVVVVVYSKKSNVPKEKETSLLCLRYVSKHKSIRTYVIEGGVYSL